MDDAGGGRRGRRPGLSSPLVDAVQREYALPLSNAKDLGGSANLNLLAARGDGQFVVRVYRSHVASARVAAVQRARTLLGEGGVPCAEAILTAGGASFVEVGRNVVEVEPFVESDAKMDSLNRIAVGLPLLGRLHGLLSAVELGDAAATSALSNYVDSVGIIEATLAGTRRIRSWSPSQEERDLAMPQTASPTLSLMRMLISPTFPCSSSTVTTGTTTCSFAPAAS